eukprot:CAMPEP_0178511904 /NCGR_PEP_ID=MMETSP0696-20121128/22609_1 /TAXON_ID=265572 /ORGANISM="Extubocellulus spinifer, Strain CCMP396" /LENGTH=505 /DNA_ID=CAMNT_0020141705 /DNA_START=36 /DNA_END=1553 /DNA_ORIENTATION=+
MTPPAFLAPPISSRWQQSSANIVLFTTFLVAIVSSTSLCVAFTFSSTASRSVFSNRMVLFSPLRQTFMFTSDDEGSGIEEVATSLLSSDAATIDPWVLRSVTFACLDGSPSSPDPQLLADYLMEVGGACSTSITDHDRDTDMERPIFREPGDESRRGEDAAEYEDWSTAATGTSASAEPRAALICGDAAVGTNVWHRCDVTAHVPAQIDIVQLAEGIRTAFELPAAPRYIVDEIPDVDWVVKVQSAWKPIVAHGFVLRFPWHSDEDVDEAVERAAAGDTHDDVGDNDEAESAPKYATITLQGGIAFGTGEHPTTRLCLGFLKDVLSANADNNGIDVKRILDYGSGSGVLGLAACSLSSDTTAVGVDIDADAVAIANANSQINGLPMQSFLPPSRMLNCGDMQESDPESASVMMKGAATADAVETLPPDLDGPFFDACAANILAGPLIGLAPTLANMVKPGARIGLSGILEAQAHDVVEAFSESFSDVHVEDIEDGWVLITGKRSE